MDFMTTKQASAAWSISQRRVAILCEQGRIKGVEKAGTVWLIPNKAQKPLDARVKSGKYRKKSEKEECFTALRYDMQGSTLQQQAIVRQRDESDRIRKEKSAVKMNAVNPKNYRVENAMITEKLSKAFAETPKLEPSFDPHKLVYDIEQCRTVSDLLKTYTTEELFNDYFVKMWSPADDYKERFSLKVQFCETNQRFELMYHYPFDKVQVRNYHDFHLADTLSSIPICNEDVFRIEFVCKNKVDWEFICSSLKHPKFYFATSDIDYNDRFGKCGLHLQESPFWFTMLDMNNMRAQYTLKYDTESEEFTLSCLDKVISFACILDNGKWKYSVADKQYDAFEELFVSVSPTMQK